MNLRPWMLIALACCAAACGGGGGRGDPDPPPAEPPAETPPPESPEAPFGLEARAPLADFDLPAASVDLGSYRLMEVFPGASFPGATFVSGIPGDDRLAVMEQAGRLRAVADGPGGADLRTVLDLSGEILFGGEQGLLGLAFDPDFVDNRYLYVHYSLDGPRRSVIARFTWDAADDRVDPASRKVLLTLEQPYANHNGGMLAFGPDGYLYIAFGDGGSAGDPENRAQDTTNLFGTLLRIDVHPADPADAYDVPPDNPHVDDDGVRPEIWAHGLRNPFRFSFDRDTGELWLGDVGQGSQEEINLIEPGGNYGWRVYEGDQPFDDTGNSLPRSAFTFPIHTYANTGGAAVIGGYVYRGSAVPSLRGRYLYADFVTGEVRALAWDGSRVTDDDLLATVSSPTSFGEDNDGEVYLVTRGGELLAFEETSGSGGDLADHLSETGLFADLAALEPASGLVEYDVNESFWSDGTAKRRWIGVPDEDVIGFAESGPWQFPEGTVLVKHFEIELVEGDPASSRRLETRVLVNGPDGWRGFTYRWNDDQSDAELVSGGATERLTVETADGPREQRYDYPSATDCLRCHTEAAGFVLGVETRQLNRDFRYAETAVEDNQLRALNHVGLFDGDIFGGAAGEPEDYPAFTASSDAGAELDARARTYLHVNCAQCHRPDGPTPVDLDLRFDTPAGAMNAVDEPPAQGDLGVSDARIVAPGDRDRSVLWLRMQRLDGERMPPLSSHVVDEAAVALIGDWIDTL